MANMDNELSVDMNTAAAQASEEAAVETALEEQSIQEEEDSSFEAPESDFWNNEDEQPLVEDASPDQDSKEPVAASAAAKPKAQSSADTISFVVDGKEQALSVEEAKKQLSLVGGARRAFSDNARMKRELAEAQKELEETRKFKASWDKIEDLKTDPDKIVELLYDKPYSEWEKERVEHAKLYADADPTEKRLLDSEARTRNLEREVNRERRQRELDVKKAEAAEFAAEQTALNTELQREFFKYNIDSGNPQADNNIKKMLWRNAVADIKEYAKKGVVPSKQIFEKAFKENAEALKIVQAAEVKKEVAKISEQKSEKAKTAAQLASARNYSGAVPKGASKLNPADLFHKVFKRR